MLATERGLVVHLASKGRALLTVSTKLDPLALKENMF
jgi:hypothetical protein